MGKKKAIASWTITAAALVSLYISLIGLPPRVDVRPHRALGERVAKEALKLRGPSGRVLLMTKDTAAFSSPAVEVQLRAFFRVLEKAGAQVAVTNLIKLDPLRVVTVPAGDFYQMASKGKEADVIVSFIGPPVLNQAQVTKLGEQRPKVLAVCTGGSADHLSMRQAFAHKILQVAIANRRDPPAAPPATNDLEAWFNYLYVVATGTDLLTTAENPSASR